MANQGIHAIYLFVLLLISHLYFCFRFLWFHAAGLPERSSPLALPLLSGTGFSVYLLTTNTESCDEDDAEVGEGVVEEELADKPKTTNGTKFDKLPSILLPFLDAAGIILLSVGE